MQTALYSAVQRDNPQPEEKILNVLKESGGYMTSSHVAAISGFAPVEVQSVLESHPEKVRRSLLATKAGEPVYLYNSPLSGFADAWNVFRDVNLRKY